MTAIEIDRIDDRVRVIRLNRPERLNALDFGLMGELHDALDEVAADGDCMVVVLTGTGRGFCAGLDLRDWGTPPEPGEHRQARAGVDGQAFTAKLVTHLRATPQVVVAAVNGPAFGGGLALACGADVRLAGRSARFCSAFIRTGLTGTDCGISYTLPRLIGVSRAFDMILSGRVVESDEAERMGLVSQVVDDGDLHDVALDYAQTLASYTRPGLLMTKEVLWHNVETTSMEAAIAIENRNQTIAAARPEVQEHMATYAARAAGRR